MILLNAEGISKSYSEKILLDNVSLGINEGDKIGLIGVNGTGKSTFLKILAGVDEAEAGTVITGNGVRIGYLPQNPDFDGDKTILEQAMAGVSPAEQEAKEFQVKNILTRLGLSDYEQKIGVLSGGQKKRVAMAAALAAETELLILDEPTNHIDSSMVDWLESYLAAYKGAIFMITHDRYFLERVANKIVELDHGKLYSYPENYSKYLELKSQREEMELASQRKRQSLLRKELEWIQRGARARGTKARFRVERYEELSNAPTIEEDAKMEISASFSRMGRKTIEIENISKSYGDKVLIKDFSYLLRRDDRLGILGPNGCGKSTLLKMIAGKIQPDSGSIVLGETVKLGYFSQECEEMDLNQRPIDYIKDIAVEVETPNGTLSASQLMETFLFDSTLQYTTIGRLSGGERRRLYLLGILMEAPNILILDEPTNDLDIQTLTILEDYLESYAGAVIVVSHDRYFLDKVVDHIFAYEGNGSIRQYNGGYTDYYTLHKEEEKKEKQEKVAVQSTRASRTTLPPKLKFTFKEQKEFETIDEDIAALEEKIEQADKDMKKASADFVRLQELMDEKAQLEEQLAEKMERWVYLNDLNDRIQAQGK
ncbi:MAG: ABC-F family ATP-binding cassette domain-containing protein [Oscillospiraceae bacterium]|nr:ABC-F family ATP-binding cassette domain-containing protein [Oscillospiraceae bacterium]